MSFDPATGIATVELAMKGRANTIDDAFGAGLSVAFDWALAQDGLKGIIVGSARKDFCVGANIDVLYSMRAPQAAFDWVRGLHALLRRIETCGVPVVAALTGSALGGGYELALACHHRIALDDPRLRVGLPEVGLGVIPGAGGTQRLPRLVGLKTAIECILQGKILRAPKALSLGLIDELAANPAALRDAAETWIAANPDAQQPWDDKRFRFPRPAPTHPDARNLFIGAAAMLFEKTAGSIPAPQMALRAIAEGTVLAFERGLEVERRYFAHVSTSDTAKDMIRTFWYHRQAALRGEGLPRASEPALSKVGILGAGMMGAGLAYIFATRGANVVLKDIAEEALGKARAHATEQATKRAKHLSERDRAALLGRITYTLDNAALADCDLVIEAVIEDDAVKAKVTREVEPVIKADGVFASNTSAIPITHLAKASARPAQFIGLHFFSPVEQMPLIEIIVGAQTSEATLSRALGVAKWLGKLPIVVNDGYGFFTSRVFAAYLIEGAQLVAEGHDPVLVEWAAKQAGMVVAPLQVFDEVTLRLGRHAVREREQYVGQKIDLPGVDLLDELVDMGRIGKVVGRGFYDYHGKERTIWPGLRARAQGVPVVTGVDYLADRLMYAQIAEVARALDEGILRNRRDAEVGAVFGIGFAPASGGPLAWMDRRGLVRVVDELRGLADTCGERYRPAPILVEMAERGERFFEAI